MHFHTYLVVHTHLHSGRGEGVCPVGHGVDDARLVRVGSGMGRVGWRGLGKQGIAE